MNLLQPRTIVKEGPFLSHRKSLRLTWKRSGSTTGNWKLERRSVACAISRCLGYLCALGSVAGLLCLGPSRVSLWPGEQSSARAQGDRKMGRVLCPWGWNSQQCFLQSINYSLNKTFSWSCTMELSHLFLFWFHSTFCFFSPLHIFTAQPSLKLTEMNSSVCVALGLH